jgi:hypothetical protein
MRTASEMKVMMDEANTFTDEMMDKAVRQLGEATARHMEKMTYEAMNNGTSGYSNSRDGTPRPVQFPAEGTGGPYISSTGGQTGSNGQGHVHTIPPPPDPTGGAVGVPIWTEEEMRVVITRMIAEAVAHLVSELDGMTQRCQELEIDLEIEKNKFNDNNWEDFEPKLRGNFEN